MLIMLYIFRLRSIEGIALFSDFIGFDSLFLCLFYFRLDLSLLD